MLAFGGRRWVCGVAGLAALGCAVADAQPVGAGVSAEGKVVVTVSDLGVEHLRAVRVTVTWSDAEQTEVDGPDEVTLNECRAVFGDDGRSLTISHRDGGKWEARFGGLTNFGRSHVDGLEIAWRAGDGEAVYGLGERFDALNVAGRRVQMWIRDDPGQGDGTSSYFVTPVLFSSAGYGFFADDNPEGMFDLNSRGDGWNRYSRAGRAASFVVDFGPDVPAIVRDRANLIGGLAPAPAWAYSPWISRNSYETQAEAEAAMDGMRERGLPFGVIVLEAWKGRSETGEFNRFSKERWPELPAFFERCRRDGVKVVLWQVPVLHPSSPWYERARKRGFLVRDVTGRVSPREGWLPGFGQIDFFNPDAVAFWKDMLRPVVRKGIGGFKADDGESIKPTDRLGDGVHGWRAHNEYSARYNQATYELLKEEGVDGMLWARSGSLGIESSPGLWAGDQGAEWPHLRRLVTAGLSASISGMPFWGHDIGGYYGTCSPELYIRWLQFGTLSPFMQFHGIEPREPWCFGEQAVAAYRLLGNLRMNLRPALVALGDAAAETGMPIMRPMFFATEEHAHADAADQFMLGADMLVAPVMHEGACGRVVRFPPGRWLYALSPMAFEGPGEFRVAIGLVDAPLFLRDGALLPVALAPGAKLGEWNGGEATRELKVNAAELWGASAVLSNVDAPLLGDPTGGEVALRFQADKAVAERLRVKWWLDDAPQDVHEATIAADAAGGFRVDLAPPTVERAAGQFQSYRIVDSAAPEGAALLRGQVNWNDLIRVTTDDPWRDVITSGATTVAGRVENRSLVACDVVLEAILPTDIAATSQPPPMHLEPGQSSACRWSLAAKPADGAVGDSRVAFVARVSGATVDRAEAALIRSPRWVLVGPFPAESKSQGFGATRAAEWEFGPEARFDTDGGRLRWEVVDPKVVANANGLDFNAIFGETTNAFVYAMALIRSDREQPVQIRVGTDDTLSLWVNGRVLIAKEYDRPALPDQDIIDATFKSGENRLLIKVAQGRGGWGLVARITGPNGAPIEGLRDALDAAAYRRDRPE